MPLPHLDALYRHYPDILTQFPVGQVFSSHRFIERLAQAHQHEYIEALRQYLAYPDPFRKLHAPLSARFHDLPNLVSHAGRNATEDIFGDVEECAEWIRL